MKKNIYFFVGTTAELIKIAPVLRAFNRRQIPYKLITTGQNNINFKELSSYIGKIKVALSFKAKQKRPSVFLFILWFMRLFFESLGKLGKEFSGLTKNDTYLIVHGDTITSLAGAVVAKINGVKLVHVESGLRSFNFFEPFPEEITRYIISKLADIHFCPNQWAVNNLRGESGEKINTRQNTLIETFHWALRQGQAKQKMRLPKKYFVLVMHRQEHVIFGQEKSASLLEEILHYSEAKIRCVFLTHDVTKKFIQTASLSRYLIHKKVIMVPRMSYPEFMMMVKGAQFFVTDGGSNQEEAYYLGIPTLVIRNVTERIEGLGQNVVLFEGKEQKLKNFMHSFNNFRKKPVILRKRPSAIIADYFLGK